MFSWTRFLLVNISCPLCGQLAKCVLYINTGLQKSLRKKYNVEMVMIHYKAISFLPKYTYAPHSSPVRVKHGVFFVCVQNINTVLENA